MRKAAKVDANQVALVRALRSVGCNVLSLAALGKGVPDLLVLSGGRLFLIEIKDGSKSASRRKLTPDQVTFHSRWPVHVVNSVEEALTVVGAIKE